MRRKSERFCGWGMPWLVLCLAFGVHVADEAVNDFLSFYNPAVEAIRQHAPWLPLPTFTFAVWLSLLVGSITVLLVLSVFAYRGSCWLRPLAYLFSGVMLLNGFQHIVASGYVGRPIAGFYSSPLLVGASLWMFVSLWRTRGVAPRGSRGASGEGSTLIEGRCLTSAFRRRWARRSRSGHKPSALAHRT